MPLGVSKSTSKEGTTQFALAELTPLAWDSGVPESEVDEALTQCLASHVPLGWVDGILQPLPSPHDQHYRGLEPVAGL